MALTETAEQPEKKSNGGHQKGVEKKEKPHSKVIVRRLPPTMDQETFLNQISPVPNHDYLYMVKGDASLGENSFARAYINFTNYEDVYDFKEKFDNYVFLDGAGHEYPAVVEFAAFQKIPKRRNKTRSDPKVASIETDPYYLEFVEMLNKPPEQDEKPEYSYQITTDNKNDTTTPLLEYVKNKRAERMRIREERREERKRKEFEKKQKFRDDDGKKKYDKSPGKGSTKSAKSIPKDKDPHEPKGEVEKVTEEKPGTAKKVEGDETEKYEKVPSTMFYKNKDRKYDDRKKETNRSKYPPPRKEFAGKREFKSSRREEFKDREYSRPSKFDDNRKEPEKTPQKKVKKYSEKREERKLEAQKAELKKQQEQQAKENEGSLKNEASSTTSEAHKPAENKRKEPANDIEEAKASTSKESKETEQKRSEKPSRGKDSNTESNSRRIRNKDRPTLAIYRPGMLSKRKQTDGDGDAAKKE